MKIENNSQDDVEINATNNFYEYDRKYKIFLFIYFRFLLSKKLLNVLKMEKRLFLYLNENTNLSIEEKLQDFERNNKITIYDIYIAYLNRILKLVDPETNLNDNFEKMNDGEYQIVEIPKVKSSLFPIKGSKLGFKSESLDSLDFSELNKIDQNCNTFEKSKSLDSQFSDKETLNDDNYVEIITRTRSSKRTKNLSKLYQASDDTSIIDNFDNDNKDLNKNFDTIFTTFKLENDFDNEFDNNYIERTIVNKFDIVKTNKYINLNTFYVSYDIVLGFIDYFNYYFLNYLLYQEEINVFKLLKEKNYDFEPCKVLGLTYLLRFFYKLQDFMKLENADENLNNNVYKYVWFIFNDIICWLNKCLIIDDNSFEFVLN